MNTKNKNRTPTKFKGELLWNTVNSKHTIFFTVSLHQINQKSYHNALTTFRGWSDQYHLPLCLSLARSIVEWLSERFIDKTHSERCVYWFCFPLYWSTESEFAKCLLFVYRIKCQLQEGVFSCWESSHLGSTPLLWRSSWGHAEITTTSRQADRQHSWFQKDSFKF